MVGMPAPSGSLRDRVEDVSRPLLRRLTDLPPMVVPLGTVVLVAVGVLAPLPIGLVALALVLLFIGWIAYLSWPAVGAAGRLWRVIMMGLIVTVAVSRIT